MALTRRCSSPTTSLIVRRPTIRAKDSGVLAVTPALVKMNLLAEVPTRKAVGQPKRRSRDTGPYVATHRRSQSSAVLARRARIRLSVCPMKGRPNEPGGRGAFRFVFLPPALAERRRNSTGTDATTARITATAAANVAGAASIASDQELALCSSTSLLGSYSTFLSR
jgi:hypothetical protein